MLFSPSAVRSPCGRAAEVVGDQPTRYGDAAAAAARVGGEVAWRRWRRPGWRGRRGRRRRSCRWRGGVASAQLEAARLESGGGADVGGRGSRGCAAGGGGVGI